MPVPRIATAWKMNAAWAICLLLTLWSTVKAAHEGKPAHTAAGIMGCVAIALVATLGSLPGEVTAPKLSTDGQGLRVDPARTQQILLGLVKLLGATALVIVGYLQFRHQISWAPEPGDHHTRRGAEAELLMPILLPLIGAACLPLIPIVLLQLVEMSEQKTYVRIRPDGVELSYNDRKQRFLRWEDIAGLPGGFRTSRGQFVGKLRFTLTTGKVVDAPIVAWMERCAPVNELLGFYLAHPALRGELTTGAALHRYRHRDYPVPARPGADAA